MIALEMKGPTKEEALPTGFGVSPLFPKAYSERRDMSGFKILPTCVSGPPIMLYEGKLDFSRTYTKEGEEEKFLASLVQS